MSGPAPGARCAVCRHPQRAAIEDADHRGVSRRQIAKDFDLGKDVVSRHFYGRHPAMPQTGQDGAPLEQVPVAPDEASEEERLRITRGALVEVFNEDPRPETAREIRQLSERIGVLSGEHRAKTARVEDVEGLPELIAGWFAALEPFPEAREAMLAATPEEMRP